MRRLVAGNVVTGIRWSPDGLSLALTLWDTTATPAGQVDVYRMAADGTALTKRTRTPDNESDVAWSPDGGWIALLGDDATQQRDLYLMRADGTRRVRLTNTPELSEGPPAWLPPAR
jgi:Tol biopolymer transport system component